MLFFSDLVGPGLGREGVTAVVTDEQPDETPRCDVKRSVGHLEVLLSCVPRLGREGLGGE